MLMLNNKNNPYDEKTLLSSQSANSFYDIAKKIDAF